MHCARILAAESLERALKRQSRTAYAEAVRLALWNELALPGACGKGGPEGEVFWKKLSESGATRARDAYKARPGKSMQSVLSFCS